MKTTIRRAALIAAALVIGGCAAPEFVSTDFKRITPEVDDQQVLPVFQTVRIQAHKEVTDNNQVVDLVNLTLNEDTKTQVSAPTASPTQDAVTYAIVDGANQSQMFRQSTLSSARTTIGDNRSLNVTPTYTRDGQYLLFSSNRSGNGQSLWRIRSDGAGGVTRITSGSSMDLAPSMVDDDETVVFQSHGAQRPGSYIWSVNLNGGLLTELSEGETPSVSPDGRQILFVKTSPDGRKQVWSMRIDGSSPTQVSSGGANDITPSWHPSGRFIVFASDEMGKGEENQKNYNVWIMRADGTDRQQITSNQSYDDSPVFLKNGRTLIFRSNRGGVWNLYKANPKI